ncbi:MAG: hypothetical protein ACRC1M_00940 [Methanobacteriaceae archaeon]
MTKRWTIDEVEKFIKGLKKEQIKFTLHGKHRLNRDEFIEPLSRDIIINKIIKSNPVLIINQYNNKYASIYEYDGVFLFVVFSIKDKHINIITLYIINKLKKELFK